MTGVALAVVGGFHVVAGVVPGGRVYGTGFLAGVAMATLLCLRQAPPSAIARWQEGAWGEELTASALNDLVRVGWRVVHDLARERGNIDHVVVGPTGVFCLDSKYSSGRLEVARHEGLRVTNRYDSELQRIDRTTLPSLRGQAAHISDVLHERTGVRHRVVPVLVWWGPFKGPRREVDGVLVVHGRELADLLLAQTRARVCDVTATADVLEASR